MGDISFERLSQRDSEQFVRLGVSSGGSVMTCVMCQRRHLCVRE